MKDDKNIYFAYRSFLPELETTEKFNVQGIKTVCFISGNTANSLGEPYCEYPPVWVWYDKYNFNALDQQINDIISVVPDAELICKIDLNTPLWWTRNTKWGNENQSSYDSYYNLGQLSHWDKWRSDTGNYLEAFLKYTQEKYPGRFKAYVLGCGAAGEWVDRSNGEESPFRLEAYKKWMKNNNFEEPKDIPGRSVRMQCSHELLRDPQKDSIGINYWKFCAWQVVGTIEFFLKKARNIVHDTAELGVFYGYILTLAGKRLFEGHLEYERLCRCPELDFFVAPATYDDRQIGGGSGFLCVVETIHRHGKQFLQECDQRTYSSKLQLTKYVHAGLPDGYWKNDEEIIAGIKREMALCLINKTSLWWFDMWGGFYKSESVLATMGVMKRLWDKEINVSTGQIAEILMVVDPQSAYYMKGQDDIEREFYQGLRKKLNRLGAPYRICSFNDLAFIEGLDKIKLMIFPGIFEMNEAKQKQISKLMSNDRVLLFCHAPGIINNGRWDEMNVKKTCGFNYKTSGLNIKKMDGWTSVYVYDPGDMTVADICDLAARAKVHFYCKAGVPVFANNRFVAVHIENANEDLTISFPEKHNKIIEIFNQKEYPAIDKVTVRSKKAETFLFLVAE